ncbi:uncharacterized protein ACNS7B_010161 [Menidia menidia]
MARGILLWVAWTCLLLDSSAVYSATTGKFRLSAATKNLESDVADDFGDQDNELSDDKPTTHVYPSSNKPPVVQPLNLIPTRQPLTNAQNTPDVEKILNAENRRWGSTQFEPITFPLSSGNQMEAPKPQSTPLVSSSSTSVSSNIATGYRPPQAATPLHLSAGGLESWYPGGNVDTDSILSSRFQMVNPGSSSTPPPAVQGFQSSRVVYPASNAAEALGQGSPTEYVATLKPVYPYPSVNELPLASNAATSYSHSNEIGPYVSQPYSPARYSTVTAKPQNYPAGRFDQGNDIDAGSRVAYNFVPPKPAVQKPTVGARPQSPAAAGGYRQGYVSRPTAYAYPQRKPTQQSSARFQSPTWMMMPPFTNMFGNEVLDLAQMGPQLPNWMTMQMASIPQGLAVPPKAYQPPSPEPRPKKFIFRSKNAYQHGRYSASKTTYVPNKKVKNVKASNGVKKP